MESIKPLTRVALLVDVPEARLVRGHVGTIVEILSPDAVLVEFSDLKGQTYSMPWLKQDDLLILHHTNVRELA
jgi:hypothetical protein